MQKIVDFLVIGSGIAGLNTARILANYGSVLLITKAEVRDSSTQYAQGGIAAVTNKKDSIGLHIDDTLQAGSYHNNKESVAFLVEHGAAAISELLKLGVPFDKNLEGEFITSFEAAHSYPRIFHATDFTGEAIEDALITSVKRHKNIEIWEHTFATDLIVEDNRCFGVMILKRRDMFSIFARATILATGGAGQLYQWTTNPVVATGDGIAMAYRAGVKITDLEFVQFHPTALKEDNSPLFLLSEVLRGEGAILVDNKDKQFMKDFHLLGDLAPRDVVSRVIFRKQKEGTIYLDIRHKGKKFLTKRFPHIYQALQKRGFDLATDLIPVTPAAHFMCGGVVTDLSGRTSVKNLFAYGEVAATGVHGANRLASNSLLEGFVFSSQIKDCVKDLAHIPIAIDTKIIQHVYKPKDNDDVKKQIQEVMWQCLGIERSSKNIAYAITTLSALKEKNDTDFIVKNMIQTALLIAESAYKRKKSLGAHYIIEE